MREVRKVSGAGNGSGQVTLPKDLLREWGLVDEDGDVKEDWIVFEADEEDGDGRVAVAPVR